MATTELQLWDEAATDAELAEVGAGELSLAGLVERVESATTAAPAGGSASPSSA